MTALNDLSDIINRVTGGNGGNPENLFVYKDGRIGTGVAVNTVAGRITSLWQYNGQPSGGVVPTIGMVPDNTTVGGLLQNNPGVGKQKWLLGMTASCLNAGTLLMYDRLAHNGGLSGTVITAQSVNLSINRNTTGIGNQIQAEVYAGIGTTSRNITATYVNENDETKTTLVTTIGAIGFNETGRVITLPLASGDKGVKSVTSIQLSASTGTAGNFGINIVNPVAIMPLSIVGVGSVRDFISGLPSIPLIENGACLYFTWLASTTAPPQVYCSLHFVDC